MTTPTRLTLSGADGNQLAADGYGPAPYQAILSHGGGQTRHAWGATARRLSEHGLPAVSLDLRGHGESDWDPQGRYAFTDHARDIAGVMRAQGVPSVLVGASLGGSASLTAAGRLGELVRAVVLVDVTPNLQSDGVGRIVAFMRANPDGFTDLDEARAAITAYQPHRTRQATDAGLRRNLRRRGDGRWIWHWDPTTLNFATTQWLAKQRREMEDATRSLTVPIILIRGADSDVVSEEDADELLGLARNGIRIDVPNARHMVAGDENDIFCDSMLTALESIGIGHAPDIDAGRQAPAGGAA